MPIDATHDLLCPLVVRGSGSDLRRSHRSTQKNSLRTTCPLLPPVQVNHGYTPQGTAQAHRNTPLQMYRCLHITSRQNAVASNGANSIFILVHHNIDDDIIGISYMKTSNSPRFIRQRVDDLNTKSYSLGMNYIHVSDFD